MIQYRIYEGKLFQTGDGDMSLKKKAFGVSKDGIELFFGSLSMLISSIKDLGTSGSTLYKQKWNNDYKTKTGYTVFKVMILSKPVMSKRKNKVK